MHTLVIAQNDRKFLDPLARYRQQDWVEPTVNGRRLRYRLEIEEIDPDRRTGGALASSGPRTVRQIVSFADGLLASQNDDVVSFSVVFMFHQTSQATVRRIGRALLLLRSDPEWRALPFKHTKHLRVHQVVLLSCESATDLVAPNPVPPALQEYVEQARSMREAADRAFTTPQAPPPNTPPTWYRPLVATFSTGNAETGGVVMNPFATEFRALPGRFGPGGSWQWDPTPAGQAQEAFRCGTPVPGRMYVHQAGALVQEVPFPAGTSINLMGYPPPP